MRNPSLLSRILIVLSAALFLSGISLRAQVVWQAGKDDGGWPLTGTAGGPDANFVQENGTTTPLPGSPNSTPVPQGADNDYYFAGTYSQTIPSVVARYGSYTPIGVVAANENSAERAFAGGDLDLRYHFNLPNSLRAFDQLSFTWDPLNLDDPNAVNTDPRFGVEVYFNGVLVQTQIVIRPAQLNVHRTTAKFSLASVNAQVGPGFDNVVSLKGISYNAEGGGNWMGVDYVQLDSSPGAGLLPNSVNIGQNKVGSVTENGNGSFTIVGGGNDIWDAHDDFTYAYTDVTGDFDVQVQVAALQANGAFTKAGLMARESLSEFSKNAFLRVTPNGAGGNGTRLAYRTGIDNVNGINGGQHEDIDGANTVPNNNISNLWLRLVRQGNTILSSNSADGITWSFVASQDTTAWGGGALSNKVYLGLAVTRNGTAPTATAEFRNFQFNTNTAPFDVIAASSRGNPRGIQVTFARPAGAGAFNAANYTIGTVSSPNVTVVTGLRLTTANDAPGRDPMTYTLEGTLGDPMGGPWTLIASGNTGLETLSDPTNQRNTVGPAVTFGNTTAYRSYRLLFPTVRNPVYGPTDNSMQVAEIELLDAGGGDVTAPGDFIMGVRAVAGSSSSDMAFAGTTQNGVNDFPSAEAPPNVIDNNAGTKYLNFAKTNTGVIVTPSGGSFPADPVVTAAVAGPGASTIQLNTSPLIEGATYSVTVAGVQAADGSALNNNSANFVHGAGYEARLIRVSHNKTDDFGYYQTSDAVANGIGDIIALGGGTFPAVQSNTLFEDPVPDSPNNERFSSRISGVLNIQTSGNYTFYMSSDDNGRLYLSTDDSPANKVQIASEPVWNGSRQYIAGDNQPSRGTPPANISAPQTLQAGKKYYLELITTEGGGGNNASATWLPPGGPAIVNGSTPIPESAFTPSRLLQGSTFHYLGPVQIVSQPTNQSVTALLPATFRVAADGTPGYTYQWRRGGTAIPGANGPSYTIPVAQLSDDQAVYSVVVANEFSSATSSNATLTVLNPTPPHLTGAAGDSTFTNLTLTFDNRIELASATNLANYTIPGLTILSATRDSTGRRVILSTSPLTQGALYTVTVRDIHDETGTTTIDPNPTMRDFHGWVFTQGFALMETYPTGAGNAVSDLRNHPSYPNNPDARFYITHIDSRDAYPTDAREGYGARISGLFLPITNGNYSFYLRSDDASQLWINTNSDTSAGESLVTEETGCCNAFSVHQSAPITLTNGSRYYYELLYKEGTGGDYGQASIDGVNVVPGQYLGLYANPDAVSVVITQQPMSQTIMEGQQPTFKVGASLTVFDGVPRPFFYQWRSNGVDIAGANSATYITPPLGADANGAIYTVELRTPGATLLSSNATVTVGADTTGPSLVSVIPDGTFTTLTLTYNERIAGGPATEAGNYIIMGPEGQLFVNAIATNINGSNVVLTIDRMRENTTYTLEIDFQTDLANNASEPSPIMTSFKSWVLSRGFARFDAYLNLTVPNNNDVSPILNSPNYPYNPSFYFYSNVVNWPQSVPDMNNYGMRWTFFFTATADGTYKFEPAHDDAVRIYAALDGNPANKVAVFDEVCCNGFAATEAGYTVSLTNGQVVYFEELVIEAGGGDYAGLSVTLPSGTYLAPIPAVYLSSYADSALGDTNGVGIAQQPQDQTIFENQTATFNVVVTNAGPNGAQYQWQVSSGGGAFTDIPGALFSSYTTPRRALANNGDQYRVNVYVLGKTITSAPATLHVNADVTAPIVLSTRGTRTLDAIRIKFNEPMDAASAQEPSNYSLTATNGTVIPLGTPVLGADLMTVTIPTAAQTPGGYYTVHVDAVRDLAAAGNASTPTNITFQTFVWSRGFATADYFFGIAGEDVPSLTNNPAYPNNPSLTEYVSLLEQRNNFGAGANAQETYGTHIYGQLLPPKTTNYNFYMSSDDHGSLYLSTDASPANDVLIASEPGWNGEREFITGSNSTDPTHQRGNPPANRSTTLFPAGISLVAGSNYYIELFAKEGGGGDNSSAAFEFPGSLRVANGSSPIQGTFLQTLADPVGASITITQQPAPMMTNVQHGQVAMLTVGAVGTNVNGSAPIAYQWQKRTGGTWRDLYGAYSATYNAPAAAGQSADYRALVFIPGAQTTSAEVHVSGVMVLTWTDPGVLQQADQITGPWTDVPGATSPYTVNTMAAPMRFYRLHSAP